MLNFIPVPYYCEENIWMLLNSEETTGKHFYAIVITNDTREVAIFDQKSVNDEDVNFWDYHVVAVECDGINSKIWDFNANLGTPCDAEKWLAYSFQGNCMPHEYVSQFKLVSRDDYLSTFVSDRSHMKNPDGTYMHTPPPWDCIGTGEPTLQKYLDMWDETLGKIYHYHNLREFIMNTKNTP